MSPGFYFGSSATGYCFHTREALAQAVNDEPFTARFPVHEVCSDGTRRDHATASTLID